jgi:hypothetical protein
MIQPRPRAGGGHSSARDPLSLALDPETPPDLLARLSRTLRVNALAG